jgi:hypothetical protein
MNTLRPFLIAMTAGLIAMPTLAATNIDMARNLVNKGNYQMASGHFAEALKTYEDASKFEPSNVIIKDNIAKAYNNWAIWLTKQKKYREAQEKLQKCLEIAPGYSQARTNMTLLKRVALEDDIDLDAPADSDPAVLPAGMPKLPPGGELKKPVSDGGAQIPKAAPVAEEQQAGAVLFIGGVKQSPPAMVDSYPLSATSGPPSGAAVVSPVGAPSAVPIAEPVVSPIPSASVPALPPKPDAGPATFTMKPQNPMFPVTPNQYPADAAHTAAPPTAVASPPSAPNAVPIVSFDEQLTAVEMKVYGSKQTNLTVLQRLEKIERESAGQIRTGTIMERINFLKSSFGL